MLPGAPADNTPVKSINFVTYPTDPAAVFPSSVTDLFVDIASANPDASTFVSPGDLVTYPNVPVAVNPDNWKE